MKEHVYDGLELRGCEIVMHDIDYEVQEECCIINTKLKSHVFGVSVHPSHASRERMHGLQI